MSGYAFNPFTGNFDLVGLTFPDLASPPSGTALGSDALPFDYVAANGTLNFNNYFGVAPTANVQVSIVRTIDPAADFATNLYVYSEFYPAADVAHLYGSWFEADIATTHNVGEFSIWRIQGDNDSGATIDVCNIVHIKPNITIGVTTLRGFFVEDMASSGATTIRPFNYKDTFFVDGDGNVTAPNFIVSGSAFKTDTTNAHQAFFQAYDVDGAAYKTFATLTNANTPTFDISAPSGGTLSGDFTTLKVGGVNVSTSSGAPTDATYITQTSNSGLSAEQALSSLSSGIMRVATTTGVITSLGDILPTANGGTGIAYFTAAGPTTARVYTFPDAAATIARTDAGNAFIGAQSIAPSSTTLTSLTMSVGSSATPAIVIGTTANNGIYGSSSALFVSSFGTATAAFDFNNSGNFRVASGTSIGFSSNSSAASAVADAFFMRGGAAGVIDQRNSTNAQKFRVYNTFTTIDTAGEWFAIDWQTTANVVNLQAVKGSSTGTARVMTLSYGGAQASPVAAITIPITSGNVTFGGGITLPGGAAFLTTNTALTDGAGAGAGTIMNAPSAGNPTKWIGINDNGTTRYIPAW